MNAAEKPPGTKRLAAILSAITYVVLGIPVWLYTTSLHRPPLPHAQIAAVEVDAANRSALLPVALQVVLVAQSGTQLPAALSPGVILQKLQEAVAHKPDIEVAVQLSVTINTAGLCHRERHADARNTCSSYDSSDACEQHQQQPCPDLSGAPTLTVNNNSSSQQRLDDWLQQQHAAAPGQYSLFLLPTSPTPADRDQPTFSPVVVGRHRNAWVTYSTGQVLQQPQQLLDAAVAAVGQALSCCFALHSSKAALAAAEGLPVSASGHTQLSFSLLVGDPSGGSASTGSSLGGDAYAWDFELFEQQYLTPVAASLAPVCHISIESRVLQYTQARETGKWSTKHSGYVMKQSQLPFFIDSDWAVESGRAVMQTSGSSGAGNWSLFHTAAVLESHVLHFLVYIPPSEQRPLLLLGPKGSVRDSNSFWIPSWGGLVVLNPPTNSSGGRCSSSEAGAAHAAEQGQQQADDSSSSSTSAAPHDAESLARAGSNHSACEGISRSSRRRSPWEPLPLLQQQYDYIAAVVLAQLQALFGVAPDAASNRGPSSSSSSSERQLHLLPAGPAGFTAWQVDALLRQRAGWDVVEAARVLGSLSRLVQELPNLEMPDLIGQQVDQALLDMQQAWQHISTGNYHAAGAAAAAARAAAEAAFLHPAVLAQLNFPESHKLGVYMPLFLPVSVPLIQGLVMQLAHYVKRQRQYRAAAAAAVVGGG